MSVLEYCANPALIEDIKENPTRLATISEELPPYAVEIKLKLKDLDNTLFSYWDIIHSIQDYELVYLTSLHSELKSKNDELPYIPCTSNYFSFPQTYRKLEPGLIDVFGTADQFKIAPLTEEEASIPYLCINVEPPARLTNPAVAQTSSIPSKEQFLERFRIFTNSQLEGWDDWENMIVVGGSVVNCLLDIPSEYQDNIADYYHNVAYKTSDIDIYCYGLTPEQYSEKIWKFYQFLLQKHQQKGRKEILVFKTPHTITFATEYPDRHIQWVFGKWDTIEHILFEPDVDCSCFAYQGGPAGGKVITTQRGKFSLNHRTNISAEMRYFVRGFPEYESRLIKYSKRGFLIRDEKLVWDNIADHYVTFGKKVLMEHQCASQRHTIGGLRLLICLHRFKQELEKIDMMTLYSGESQPTTGAIIEGSGVPYGPQWTMDIIRQAYNRGVLTVSTNYGCSIEPNTDSFTLLQAVLEANHLFVPHSDKLICNPLFQLGIEKELPEWEEPDPVWYDRIFNEQLIEEIVEMKDSFRADPEDPDDDSYSYEYITSFYASGMEDPGLYYRTSFWDVVDMNEPEENEQNEEENEENEEE